MYAVLFAKATATTRRGRRRREERYHLPAPQPPTQNRDTARVDPVNLKNMLRQIQPDRRNLAHGWLPLMVSFSNHHSGTWMPFGGHPPHHSMTSSAVASSVGGMVRPSALAAFIFMKNSDLVG
jgi:hypothetical protein